MMRRGPACRTVILIYLYIFSKCEGRISGRTSSPVTLAPPDLMQLISMIMTESQNICDVSRDSDPLSKCC